MAWHFSSISLQYIVGGSLSLIITGYILYKNPKTLETIYFFLYGLFTSIWALFIFLHRTAPTADASRLFFKVAMFSLPLYLAFLLMTILSIRKPKKSYLLCAIPAVILGTYIVVSPIEIVWGRWGWSYGFLPGFMNMFIVFNIMYSTSICIATFLFIKKCRFLAVERKYKIILYVFLFHWIITLISNYMISTNPNFPPSAGFSTTIFFLFVAYAISLPTGKISPSSKLKKSSEELAKSYLQLLNTFQSIIPGKELGSGSFRFEEYIEAMGLKDVVVSDSGKLIFKVDKLSDVDINGISDNILKIIKEHPWAVQTIDDFTPVLVRTYETLQLQSKGEANEWFDQMLQRHGGFLGRHGVLAAMPKDLKIPEILKELRRGRAYLFKEEKPVQAYKKLKEALNYGFAGLAISKLHPEKVRKGYGIGEASILWLTFQGHERATNPKDLPRLNGAISEFVEKSDASIVLLDCFDQIKLANGFQKSLTVLKGLRNLRSKKGSIIIVSINPEIFEEQQLSIVEEELEEVGIE